VNAEPKEDQKLAELWGAFYRLASEIEDEIAFAHVPPSGNPFGNWPLDKIKRLGELSKQLKITPPLRVLRNSDSLSLSPPRGCVEMLLHRKYLDHDQDPQNRKGPFTFIPVSTATLGKVLTTLKLWQNEAEHWRVRLASPSTEDYLRPGEAMGIMAHMLHLDLEAMGDGKARRLMEKLKKKVPKTDKKTIGNVEVLRPSAWRAVLFAAASTKVPDTESDIPAVIEARKDAVKPPKRSLD